MKRTGDVGRMKTADEMERDAEEYERRAQLLRVIATNIREIYGLSASTDKRRGQKPRAGRVTRRKGKPADGSLGDRILELARDPMAMPDISSAAKARIWDVKREVRRLVAADQLRGIGKGRWTKYQVKAK